MFNEYSEGCTLGGVVRPVESGRQMLVVVVLSARDCDSLAGEELRIGVRKGRLSSWALGGEFVM